MKNLELSDITFTDKSFQYVDADGNTGSVNAPYRITNLSYNMGTGEFNYSAILSWSGGIDQRLSTTGSIAIPPASDDTGKGEEPPTTEERKYDAAVIINGSNVQLWSNDGKPVDVAVSFKSKIL